MHQHSGLRGIPESTSLLFSELHLMAVRIFVDSQCGFPNSSAMIRAALFNRVRTLAWTLRWMLEGFEFYGVKLE